MLMYIEFIKTNQPNKGNNMIKLGVFQLTAKGHGYTLSVEKTVDVKESVIIDGKKTFTSTGEVKKIVETIGFYPRSDQVMNRIIQHELSKTEKNGSDLSKFIESIDSMTVALNNFNGE